MTPLSCPRCDAKTAETAKFCSACGAAGPAATADEQEIVEEQPAAKSHPQPSEQPAAAPASAGAASAGPLWRASGPALGAAVTIAVIILVAVTLAVAGSGGDEDAGPPRAGGAADPGVTEADLIAAETAANQRCVELWNSEENDTWKSVMGTQSTYGDAYVSVGFAADYPDKCLITVSIPGVGTARQFLESGGRSASAPSAYRRRSIPTVWTPALQLGTLASTATAL